MLLAACVTQEVSNKPEPVANKPAEPQQTATLQPNPSEQPTTEGRLVYSDSLTFDLEFSQALRASDDVYVLATPDGVNLNEIPDDLDRWLSRIRDQGGEVKAAPLNDDGSVSRSWIGALIDVILFFVGLAKDEIVFSAVDEFDAVMYYDKQTGNVKEIVFTRRQPS